MTTSYTLNELDDEITRLARANFLPQGDFRADAERFLEAQKALAASGWKDDGPEWTEYEGAEHAVIVYPCQTIEDARVKVRFFLENDDPYDTIRNCRSGEGETLRLFLASLTGGASCD
jgi:hypothetical protein